MSVVESSRDHQKQAPEGRRNSSGVLPSLLLSSDAHIVEPPDLWRTRIDKAFAHRAPQIQRIDGDDRWLADGRFRMGNLGNAGAAGKRFENSEISIRGRFDEIRPGAWEPGARLKDMDVDGVYAEVLYPTVAMHAFRIPDAGLLRAICQAYNGWLAEFCSAAPHRFLGAALVPLDHIDTAVVDAAAARRAGLSTLAIPSRPPQGGYNDPKYERFWAAAADLDIPLSLHVGSQRRLEASMTTEQRNTDISLLANRDMEIRQTLMEMIMSGVFERHPKLRIVALEYEASWVPHFLFRLDDLYTNRAQGQNGHRFKNGMLPSQQFREQVYVSFQEDPHIEHVIGVISEQRLIWGSDYPHAESTWPRSRQVLGQLLANCPRGTQRAVTAGNVAQLYGIELPGENSFDAAKEPN